MAKEQSTEAKTTREEQIGFHKGALSTLAKERQELAKIIAIVEQLMQMHVKALKDLGIDLVKEAEKIQKAQKEKKPIEEML